MNNKPRLEIGMSSNVDIFTYFVTYVFSMVTPYQVTVNVYTKVFNCDGVTVNIADSHAT